MLDDQIFRRLLHKSRKSASSRILAKTAMKALMDEFRDPIEIRRSLKRLQSEGMLEYSADPQGLPVSAYITINRPVEVVAPHLELWRETLAATCLTDLEKSNLDCLGNMLQGVESSTMAQLIEGLVRLRADQHKLAGQMAFNVSAAYLLGASKLLGSLDSKALKEFGINASLFLSRPPYLVVSAPQNASTLILVENPIAFENAILSGANERCAFVCTFGFGLSNAGNEYGSQLAGAIETGNSILLHRGRTGTACLDDLLKAPNVFFWGDLDIAGIQIYERLARKIPHLKLSRLYEPMINSVQAPGNRHPYISVVGKQGQTMSSVARPESRALLTLCKHWGVDQELVTVDQINLFADMPLKVA